MSPLTDLILLVVIIAAAVIAWRFHQHHQENKLRENFPQRRAIEVALPRGITDSNKRMQKFYSKVVTAAQSDAKARRQGLRQVDVVYLAEVKQGHTVAEVRFLIYADEDKMDAVKRALKQVFDGMAHVTELAPGHDPMDEIAAQLRPSKGEERAHDGATEEASENEVEASKAEGKPKPKTKSKAKPKAEPDDELGPPPEDEPVFGESSLRARMHRALDRLDERVAAGQRRAQETAASNASDEDGYDEDESEMGGHDEGGHDEGGFDGSDEDWSGMGGSGEDDVAGGSLRERVVRTLDTLDERVAVRQRRAKGAVSKSGSAEGFDED